MSDEEAPRHPIIYVRGYAMTQGEIDETTADPFCGFNLGSTVYRATPDKEQPAKKFVFESPVVRLASDYEYADVFDNGLDIMDQDWEGDPKWNGGIPRRSIIVYRYYEQASRILGTGKTPAIEEFAKGLGRLILRVRDLVCNNKDNGVKPQDFRCYLVAHSMGGLVCRAFLQNPVLDRGGARRHVDKVFTYATPHNGIEMAGVNVPGWLTASDMDNFHQKRMAEYLNLKDLYKKTGRVDWIPEESFPSERVFCMIGTNRADYEVAMGMSRTFAGHGSDGLVRIANASVWGVNVKGQVSAPCATAYAYRSHSGYFGIVNSEEAYQNLTRFLFGDVRTDMWVDIDEVRLPPAIQGKAVDALYQFEVLASPRGKRWYLTRRTAEEDSAACRTHKELMDPATKARRSLYLSTVFLSKRWRVNPKRPSLAYNMTLGVRVPDYEVERRFWPDGHYEGGYLFRDSVIIEIVPPQEEGGDWTVTFDWQNDDHGAESQPLDPKRLRGGKVELTIPFDSEKSPGISGRLRFVVSEWND